MYLQWYLAMSVLHDKLDELPVLEWAEFTIEPLISAARARSDPAVRSAFISFIILVQQTEATEDDVQAALGSFTEGRPKVIRFLRERCQVIKAELTQFEGHLVQAIDSYVSHVITTVNEATNKVAHLSPMGIYGTWVSDDAIPAMLKATFLSQVARLEKILDEFKDWHPNPNPNTDHQVLNLVHPSLFCCVFGKTKQKSEPPSPNSFTSPAEQMATLMFAGSQQLVVGNGDQSDKFQWIPTDFEVDEDGSVRTLSYINNLHPGEHAPLYSSIEALFGRFVPMFERVLNLLTYDTWPAPIFEIPFELCIGNLRPSFPESSAVDKPEELIVELRDTTVQVIVKVSEVLLSPESPVFTGDAWHFEGSEAENIVSTGIYCFASENIQSPSLSVRAKVVEPDFDPYEAREVVPLMYGLEHGDELAQSLGSVSLSEDRCLVIPNNHQHKLDSFELQDSLKPGFCKLLTFFLVDPDESIPSTSVIPPQQQTWIDAAQRPLFKKLRLVDAAEDKVRQLLVAEGISKEEATELCCELTER